MGPKAQKQKPKQTVVFDQISEQKEQQAREDQVPEKEQAESLEVELQIQDEDEFNIGHKEQVYTESSVLPILKQLIKSRKEMLDAITSQNKILEDVINLQTEIATKDDLESFERDLGRRLEAIGEDIVLQVVNGLQEALTSSSSKEVGNEKIE